MALTSGRWMHHLDWYVVSLHRHTVYEKIKDTCIYIKFYLCCQTNSFISKLLSNPVAFSTVEAGTYMCVQTGYHGSVGRVLDSQSENGGFETTPRLCCVTELDTSLLIASRGLAL